ncbi:MAG: methionyl-tRNA formyltransferase [bacterium]|nr:methionyl-tRNA formyltransferase [bacterium]
MNIVFFGTEDFSSQALKVLIESGLCPVLVITKPDSKKGRGQKVTEPAVKSLARQYDIPVLQPVKLSEIHDDVTSIDKPVGVLVSFGKIIPQQTIDLFTPGIINLHPSLLPKWRGPSPIESAIASGDTETGVSIMQLVKAMDAGPVYVQKKVALQGEETQPALYEKLGAIGSDLLVEYLPGIVDGTHAPVEQDEAEATYSHLLQKSDSLLDPTTVSATEANRQVRAHLDFPKTKLTVDGSTVIIKKSHVTRTKASVLDIEFQDGAYLAIDELIAPSGKTMDQASFLRGHNV